MAAPVKATDPAGWLTRSEVQERLCLSQQELNDAIDLGYVPGPQMAKFKQGDGVSVLWAHAWRELAIRALCRLDSHELRQAIERTRNQAGSWHP